MYNTGILVKTLALKKCSSRRKSLAEFGIFSQLSFVQNNTYSEHVCCQFASKIRTLYDCFSFVKSFLEKEESDYLDKTIKIDKLWRTTIASTPENETPILKTKFKNTLQKLKSKLKNKLEIRLYTDFAMTVI